METKYLILGLVVVIVAIGGAVGCGLIPINETNVDPVQNESDNESNTMQNESDNKTQNVDAKEVCTNCNGKGYLICGVCEGSGGDSSCYKCGGDGKVYIDENGDMKPNVVYVKACHEETCPVCDGTGGSKNSCNSCGGDGKIKCNVCGGDGEV